MIRVPDAPIEIAVEPGQGGHEHQQVAARAQRREGARELAAVVLDVLEHVDVGHGIERLGRRLGAEEGVDRAGALLARQARGKLREHVRRGLVGREVLDRVPQQQGGDAADPGPDLGHAPAQERGQLAHDPVVVVHGEGHGLELPAGIIRRHRRPCPPVAPQAPDCPTSP